MIIKLQIDNEEKTFTTPFVPMLAKRKWLEYQADESNQESPEEYDKTISILTDIVFKNQFSLDELYSGASEPYVMDKLREAIYGKKPEYEEDSEAGK
jgi:hypothetical protein